MYSVMIVDDEAWARQLVKSLVDWKGLNLVCMGEAEDGYACLELMETSIPNIIITDMRMPGLNGVEWLQMLQQRYPAIKIIVMSGYNDFNYLKQAIVSRAFNYLLKPIHSEELAASLMMCIAQLNEEHKALEMNVRAVVRLERNVLEQYLNYRRLIKSHLADSNTKRVEDTFKELAQYLSSDAVHKEIQFELPYKLANEFISMLEEYLSSDQMNINIMIPELAQWQKTIEACDVIHAVAELSSMFQMVMTTMQTARQKSKLNIEEVNHYIHQHFRDNISLDNIAGIFLVSKEHLSRTYKLAIGETVSDTIIQLRMEEARHLIVNKGFSIKKAAELSGYVEIPYFYRVFKKYFGYPPGELRK